MLGGWMKLQPITEPLGFLGSEGRIQRSAGVRIQVVAHQPYLDRFGIMHVEQFLDTAGPFDLAPLVRHPDVPPTTQRLEEHEQIACPLTLVFAVYPTHLLRLNLLRLP